MSIRSALLEKPRRLVIGLLPLALAACSAVPSTVDTPPTTTVPLVPTPTDLVVTSGSTGVSSVVAGSTFRPIVEIKDQGGTDVSAATVVGVAVTLDDMDTNNPDAWSDSQKGLKAGASVSLTANGGPNGGLVTAPATVGDHTLGFTVDNPYAAVGPTGRVLESVETNNTLTVHFQVVAATTPPTTPPVTVPPTSTPPTTTPVTVPPVTVPPVVPSGTSNAKASFGFYPRYGNISGLQSIESWLGRKAAYVAQFSDITSPAAMVNSLYGEIVQPGKFQTLAGKAKFVLGVPLSFRSDPSLVNTVNGVNDSAFRSVASQLAAAGYPDAVIRLGWEFDGDWMPWAAPGKEATFIAAFRHVHDVFTSVSNKFRFDFNGTTGVDGWKTTWAKSYPGDAYVDIIGSDAYDRGPGVLSRLPAALKAQRDMAIAHGKQISFPEWGLCGGGTLGGEGDNPAYVQAMADFMNSSPASGPGSVAYHAYFNENVADGNHTIDSFPNAQVRFKTLFGA